ncbi:MAG: sigma-E processing peptidase SpoIIGA, partial [Clostridia bacterium]|nr:sigma-E processing peptidase SpoIIGA [Clostridia bacterium]
NGSLDFTDIYLTYYFELKLKLIPYHSIGGDGFILGFIPDRLTADNKEIHAVIGISNSNITYDKKYSGIINPQIC